MTPNCTEFVLFKANETDNLTFNAKLPSLVVVEMVNLEQDTMKAFALDNALQFSLTTS